MSYDRDNYGNRRKNPRKDQLTRGAAAAGAMFTLGTTGYNSTQSPTYGYQKAGDYSANQRRNDTRRNTSKPRYTLGDAIAGKKPPKSKWGF